MIPWTGSRAYGFSKVNLKKAHLTSSIHFVGYLLSLTYARKEPQSILVKNGHLEHSD